MFIIKSLVSFTYYEESVKDISEESAPTAPTQCGA